MQQVQKIHYLKSESYSKPINPNYVLTTSSLCFIFPSIICYLYNQYLMSTLCAMLMLTSIEHHGNPSLLSYILDQIMIQLVVINVHYLAYQLGFWTICRILLLKSYCIFIYYGPYADRFVFHPNKIIGDLWHASMHIFLAFAICIAQPYLILL